jgi:predicted Rossmann-fold nucleotide-binding protein
MATPTFYVGTSRDGTVHKIERFVDPVRDGTRYAEDVPPMFDVRVVGRKLAPDDFDKYVFQSIPDEVYSKIDTVLAEAARLAELKQADAIGDAKALRRAVSLSWLHSRDMQVIMQALKHPKALKGVHDIDERVPGARLKETAKNAADWYANYVRGLADDDKVNVGFFNPYLCASLHNWGDDKHGVQNAMEAHRLSAHHNGTPEAPIDYVERAVNFVLHHLPREHQGIRHEAQGQWINLDERLASDPSTKNDEIIQVIARDAAVLMMKLEQEGKITPWHLLDASVGQPFEFDLDQVGESPSVMRDVDISGIVKFVPERNRWSIGGASGWYLSEASAGEPLSVKIAFFEPLERHYQILFTPISEGTTIIKNIECSYAGEEGFRVYIDTQDDRVSGTIGFSFSVKGRKLDGVPDDKFITKDERIEDMHAITNILVNEAEYGVVTVMASASIVDAASIARETKKKIAEREAEQARLALAVFDEERAAIGRAIERIDFRLARLAVLETKTPYWDSAYRFGKLWGEYAATQIGDTARRTRQQIELGGRYVPIMTGGGPGVMAAVAKGASEKHAQVIGIDSIFGNDKRFDLAEDFSLLSNVRLRCNDFATREAALINYSHVILFWPGGYGTCWEAFETLSKLQTRHLRRNKVKVIFVHQEFWMPMFTFIKHLEAQGTINAIDDRIKVKGIDQSQPDDHYLAEFVADENEAFDVTVRHLRRLQAMNMLSLT